MTARGRPSGMPTGGDQDPFLRTVTAMIDWARDNVPALVVSLVGLAVLAGGVLYYRSYRASLEERAGTRLQEVAARIGPSPDSISVRELRTFLERFGETPSAARARLLLGRQLLLLDRPGEALEQVEELQRRPPNDPLGFAARRLLARAAAAAGDTARALEELQAMGRNARFAFQRREARAERAELLAASGRLREAESVYDSLVRELEERVAEGVAPGEELARYRLRLGEVRGRLASSAPSNGAPAPSAADSAAAPESGGEESAAGS